MRMSDVIAAFQEASGIKPYRVVMDASLAVSTVAKALRAKANKAPDALSERERNEFEQHLDEIDRLVLKARAAIKRW